ncbi:MAG TPA: hypothetical protein VJA66_04075, partial [Thermoanaerobaculia bacterium]
LSTVDISNNTATDTEVDFYLDGIDLTTSASISVNGFITTRGSKSLMGARSTAHFDDFIDTAVQAGILPASIEPDGFIGSCLFVFNGYSRPGQGSATVRFYNSSGGGTIGQAIRGHVMSNNEPQSLVASFYDKRGQAGPQLYPNMFINNTGLTPSGAAATGPVTVHIQAYANSSGSPVGVPIDTAIGIGQTVGVNDVLNRMQVPATDDTVIVFVTVTSGTATIAGVSAEVDATTRDGSTVDMPRADF